MRFRWIRQTSRAAVISATATRVMLRDLSIEEALKVALPHYSVNPEALSQLEQKRLFKEVRDQLNRIEEIRRGGTDRRRMRG